MASIIRSDSLQNINTSNIITQTNATTLTIGASGQNIIIPSGVTFNASSASVNLPAVNLTTGVTGTLPVANGGTGLTAIGSSLQVLRTNTSATALEFATISTGAAAGQVIQVVTDKKTTGFTTSSQNVFVTTNQTLSITTASASNKVLVMFNAGSITTLAANTAMDVQVRRSGTVVCFGGYYTATVGGNQSVPFGVIHTLDSPSTTSSITYEVFAQEGGIPGTVSLNADRVLTLLEVKG